MAPEQALGALRWGQWPMLSMTLRVLCGRWRCRYSPTVRGAMMSLLHWMISVGDPAHEIIEAASNMGCDLIVMGSRGLTGLDRIFLGSVARNVLQHTRASVLIVREPVRERLPERPREEEVSLAATSAAG